MQNKQALIMIDHGSKKPEAHDDLVEWGKGVAALLPEVVVRVAHMEICAPSLLDVVSELDTLGIKEIAVVPLFLGRGKHLQQDIPGLVEECRLQFTHINIRQKNALFGHSLLNEIVALRFAEN
jgi:sirohydrochlorin ferrochelatase